MSAIIFISRSAGLNHYCAHAIGTAVIPNIPTLTLETGGQVIVCFECYFKWVQLEQVRLLQEMLAVLRQRRWDED